MTTYQKQWHQQIDELLNEINASDKLRLNIIDTLKDYKRTQIFPNHIINALKIGISIQNGSTNTALVAPMQSGKSGTVYFLCNYILPEIKFLNPSESVLFVTSMRDTDLFEQNKINLEQDFYDKEEGYTTSYIQVVKMNDFFLHPNPHKIVRDFNVKLVVRDEDQYGCGIESSFDNAFFNELRQRIQDLKLLAVSATPYDILDAKLNGYEVDVIEGERPEGYFGITEMLSQNLIENYSRDFNPIEERVEGEDTIYSIHPTMNKYVQHLLKFEDGLGIVRVSKTSKAITLRTVIRNRYKSDLECVCIGSDSDCDFSIKDGLDIIAKKVMRQNKRVVLIVVQALTAGKDLRNLKEKVRFGIESRGSQLANGAQGIAGRLCGYHRNRDFKLMANVDLLNHYSQFEQDWEVYSDEDWKENLYDLGIRKFSTHTSQSLIQKERIVRPIQSVQCHTIDELIEDKTRKRLSFISDSSYENLLSYFQRESFQSNTKGTRFGQHDITIRLASSYRKEDNRVYKNWINSSVGADFGSIMFKKQEYKYGILISNYPVGDPRNTIGFCGIKVLESSEPIHIEQLIYTDNNSMYLSEEDERLIS